MSSRDVASSMRTRSSPVTNRGVDWNESQMIVRLPMIAGDENGDGKTSWTVESLVRNETQGVIWVSSL